jgi:hypothetical protein
MTTQFAYGNITYIDGILHIEYYNGVLLDVSVFMNEIQCRKKLTGNDDFFLLLDMSKASDITENALAFAADHPFPENIKAIGVVTRPGNDHLRAKLYSVFDKPNIPTKAFLNAEDVKRWFDNLVNKKAA